MQARAALDATKATERVIAEEVVMLRRALDQAMAQASI
jgi:hypothetical protein